MTEKTRPSRRRLLGMLGSSAASTVYAGTGFASADPDKGHGQGDDTGRGVGPCTCEEDCPEGTFCGTIDGAPEEGETYTFTEDDDEYSVTIDGVVRKEEENEVICFEFLSDDDIQRVCIKGGPETESYGGDDLDGELCAPEKPGGQQAGISNVSFCGTGAECFQIDLVGGEPIEQFDPDEGTTYSATNRLISDYFVCSGQGKTGRANNDEEFTVTVDGEECTFTWNSFRFDGRVASVDLTFEGGSDELEGCTGTLAGYLLPDGVQDEPGDLEAQELRAADTEQLAEGETKTLTITLDRRIEWRFDTGAQVTSSPTVVDGTVYVNSSNGVVYSLNTDDGEEAWRFETGDGVFFSSPNVVNGSVYFGSGDGNVYALSADDGEEQWHFDTGLAVESSPTVTHGTVYVGSQDEHLYALDADDGKEQWRFETRNVVRSSPTVVEGLVYISSHDENVYAIDGDMGEERWRFETDERVDSSPTVTDGTVYVGGGHNDAVYSIDATTGEELWRFDTTNWTRSSPTVREDMVYIGSVDENVYALDADDGEERWRFDAEARVQSSPTVVDDTVYVGSGDNNVYALDADDGEERWRFETGAFVHSSPTVVDGVLYVGSGDHYVYALDVDADGDSDDSRVGLGTLGHHDLWADQITPVK